MKVHPLLIYHCKVPHFHLKNLRKKCNQLKKPISGVEKIIILKIRQLSKSNFKMNLRLLENVLTGLIMSQQHNQFNQVQNMQRYSFNSCSFNSSRDSLLCHLRSQEEKIAHLLRKEV